MTKRLVEAGATVIFTSRDAIKGNKAVEDVHSYLEEGRFKTPREYDDDGDASTPTSTPFMGKVHVANLDLCVNREYQIVRRSSICYYNRKRNENRRPRE